MIRRHQTEEERSEVQRLKERLFACEKLEKEFKESEARFRTLVEQIPAITYIAALDRSHTLLYVSPQVEHLLGYSPREYMEDPDMWRKLLHPEDHNRVMAELLSSRVSDRTFVSEYRKLAKDGSIVWLHDEAVVVKDTHNKPLFLQGVMFDITERKHAEESLKNSFHDLELRVKERTAELSEINESLKREISERKRAEAVVFRLASFTTLNPMPVVEIDTNGKVTYINPRGAELFPDLLTEGFTHPFLAGIPETVQRLQTEGKESTMREIEISGMWYSQTVFIIRPGIARIYASNITEKKLTESALMESEESLKSVIHGSPIPQFVIDRNHRVLYWNKALEKHSGLKASEIVGTKNHWKAFYQSERPCISDLLVENSESELSRWYDNKFRRSELVEGAYEAVDFFPRIGATGKWLYFTAAVIRDTRNVIIGAVETLEDITERKVAEETLRTSEERFRTVANFIYNWEYWLSREKRILFMSPSSQRLTGYSREEFLRDPGLITKIIHPDDRPAMEQHFSHLEEKKDFELELRIVRKDGTVVWINHICHPVFDSYGIFRGRRVSSSDITACKTARQQVESRVDECRLLASSFTEAAYRGSPGRREFLNDAVETISGYSAQELNASPGGYEAIIHPEDRERADTAIRAAAQEQSAFRIRYRIVKKTGEQEAVVETGKVAGGPEAAAMAGVVTQGKKSVRRRLSAQQPEDGRKRKS